MLTQEEFEAMLQRDLKRAKLNQKTFAQAFVLRGEQLSNVTITHWKQQGYIPGARLQMALEILGPNSELAKVPMSVWHELWAAGKTKEKEFVPSGHSFTQDIAPVREVERQQAMRSLMPNLTHVIQRLMPSEYWANFNPPMEDRDRRHIPSYQRAGLVVQIVLVRPGIISRNNLLNAIFKLSVIKAVFAHEAPRAHVVLVVLGEAMNVSTPFGHQRADERYYSPQLRDDMLGEYAYDAQALNVQMQIVNSPEDAAKFLLDMATRTISEPLDEDGVEDLDPDEEF